MTYIFKMPAQEVQQPQGQSMELPKTQESMTQQPVCSAWSSLIEEGHS